MSIRRPFLVWLTIMLLRTYTVNAQQVPAFEWEEKFSPEKMLCLVQKRSAGLAKKLSAKKEKYAARIKKREAILLKKIIQKDSTLGQALSHGSADIESNYNELQQQLAGLAGPYSGRLDSLNTAIRFIKSNTTLSGLAENQLQQALAGLDAFKNELETAQHFKNVLQRRSDMLQHHAQKLGMLREMRRYSKELFYYRAQIDHYIQVFESPRNAELKLLQVVSRVPQFRKFFAANAQLARLFTLPDPGNAAIPSLEGLQTISSVGSLLSQRFGADASIEHLLPAVQKAKATNLKDVIDQYKVGQLGNGGSEPSETNQFKPNAQRTKSFMDRLELGANFQSQKSAQYFPVTSNIALHVGYKLNDKSVIGLGAAYKMGWGSGWNNIRISHQGFGLRSFLDWQLKGSFYISGGYEQNYQSAFKSISILKHYSAWQSSGLIGVSRKFRTGKLRANMQLLWDFLADRQVPRTQPLVWRIGYSLK